MLSFAMSDITPVQVEKNRPEPDLSGRELGAYRILRRLGRGGMAEVYLAEQTSLHRQIAVKVLKASLADDESYVRRFHHEARAAASLVHANIVQIYEVGCIDGVHYISQEYVPGQNLRQLLAKRMSLEPATAVSILRQTAAALHKASQQGIVHRDIKPENIMVTGDGEVKVADFGLARVTATNGAAMNITQAGITMGTPLYMSPEQVEGRQLDHRSDLYSLGVTIYHLLAGRPPFEGETALAIAVQHLHKSPERLESLRPDLPEALGRIVHRMMSKSVDERFQSAAELLRELKTLRVAGAPADWSTVGEDWASTEMLALGEARVEATQRLDVLMKAESDAQPAPITWRSVLLVLLVAFLIGGAIAWARREPPLLAVSKSEASQVRKLESAEAQYRHAMLLGSEEGWRAVSTYFPPKAGGLNKYYSRRAQQQLARLYLKIPDYNQALAEFNDLAKAESSEKEFIAFGLAGQAVVYHLIGDRPKMAEAIATLKQADLLDPDLKSEIERLQRLTMP